MENGNVKAKPKSPMDTEIFNLKWRSWSKNVAYVDLTLISMGLPAGIICVIMGVNAGVSVHPGFDQLNDDQRERVKKAVVTVAITMLVVLSCLGIWAAIKLMSATEPGRDRKDALKMARFWKNVNLVFIALALVGMIFTQTFFTYGLNLIWHAILLYIVCQYIQELEESVYLEYTDEEQLKPPQQEPSETENVVETNEKV